MAGADDETFQFEIGDKVLAYYDGLLYKATCTDRRFSDTGIIQYYVHYTGFKKRWDEWSDYDEVLEINKINLAHKENLESVRLAYRANLVKKSQEARTNASSAQPKKRKRGRPKKNAEQSAGPSSAKNVEQSTEPSSAKNVEKSAGPSSTKFPELAIATFVEPAVAKFVEAATTNFVMPASTKIRNLTVQVMDILKYPEIAKTKFAGLAPAQLAELAVEKSSIQKCAEPDSAQITEPATAQLPEAAVETLAGPSTSQFATLVSTHFTELAVEESEILKFAEKYFAPFSDPATAQFSGPAVDKSAESALQSFSEPTTSQFSELAVNESDLLQFEEPYFDLFTKPATTEFLEPAVDKSAESALQSFSEPNTTEFSGLTLAQFAQLAVEKSAMQTFAGPSTSQFTEPSENSAVSSIHTFSEPDVRSKRVKKSQEPWTPEDASSSTPAKKKRDRPKQNVEHSTLQNTAGPSTSQPAIENLAVQTFFESATVQFAGPASAQFAGPASSQFAEQAIAQFAGPASAQFAEQAIAQFVEPAVGESIQTEVEAAVQIVENVVIDIIPHSEQLAIELLEEMKLRRVLRRAIKYDRLMNFKFKRVLKFAKGNSFAEIIYTFTNSSYFIDDDQKKNSTMFCLTLMKYFNICVHNRLTYPTEKKFYSTKKGAAYFETRMNVRPSINKRFKHQLNPKRLFCYLYGPMYLLRFIDALPTILLSNSWFPDYDLETFVHQIKGLLRFLADNFMTYFSECDYMKSGVK